MAEIKFEESLKKIEDIVEKLESGDLPLEESLKLYEDGIKLIKTCLSKLEEVERKIEILVKDKNGKISAKPFKIEENKESERLS